MPSDPRLQLALDALARPLADFRAIVEGAIAQGDAVLAARQASVSERAEHAAATLGWFAEGRIDPARFAALFPATAPLGPEAVGSLERALDVLRKARELGEGMLVVDVPAGTRLGTALDTALSAVGRALGAVVLAELVRGGRHEPGQEELLKPQPFRTWNRAERRFAPPLVVLADGADLQASALMDYADGREKLVLVVRGACPPAPLARCITPGTFVLQTADGTGLDRLAAFDGPAVAAMVPEGAALFMHDPGGGREPWQRLTVHTLPEPPKRAIGGQSAWQMTQDLRVLSDLAITPFSVPAPGGNGASPAVGNADATERIAAWLLAQAAHAEGQA